MYTKQKITSENIIPRPKVNAEFIFLESVVCPLGINTKATSNSFEELFTSQKTKTVIHHKIIRGDPSSWKQGNISQWELVPACRKQSKTLQGSQSAWVTWDLSLREYFLPTNTLSIASGIILEALVWHKLDVYLLDFKLLDFGMPRCASSSTPHISSKREVCLDQHFPGG